MATLDPAGPAAALVAGTRGLLSLSRPCPDVHELLRGAGIAVTEEHCAGLRTLALTTPGLARATNGVVVGPDHVRMAVAAVGTPTRPGQAVPIGVHMPADPPGDLATALARHVAEGATFACRTVAVGTAAARSAARWAAQCQRSGLVPLLDCRSATPRHRRLAESEQDLTTALGTLLAELPGVDVDPTAALLGIRPVVPGHRSWEAGDSAEVAAATVRSLRAAGACRLAGVVVGPPRRAEHLTAHLVAMHWLRPPWTTGFCLGRTALAILAATWRGRPERAAGAQRALRTVFADTSATVGAAGRELAGRL